MPNVNGKKYPYTPKGKADAKRSAKGAPTYKSFRDSKKTSRKK